MKSADKVDDIPVEAREARPRRDTGRRLHGAVANKIGSAIVSGEYAPGDRLQAEVVFSESLDVSRSAYREAVQVLAAKGLVESRTKAVLWGVENGFRPDTLRTVDPALLRRRSSGTST